MNALLKSIRLKFSDVHHITTQTLSEWIEEEKEIVADSLTDPKPIKRRVIMIDARPDEEYSISHIAGAKRLDHDVTTSTLCDFVRDSLQPLSASQEQHEVVCYCSLGYRSAILARNIESELRRLSVSPNVRVHNLEGSIFKWANEERPMVDSKGNVTRFVHPYNSVFGMALKSELRKAK